MADDTKRPTRKLPRGPNAPKPGPDERVRKQGGADLQNGWLGRHGTLTLTDDRLVFVPTLLDTVLRAKRREIPLDRLLEVERWPKHPGDIPAGAKRPRLYLHTPECVYELMLPDMDAWFDAIQKVYALRAKRGLQHAPVFTREGVENLMLAED
jgi:hypothetical protein